MSYFQLAKNIGRKNTMVMKILPHIQYYDESTKMQKNAKNIFENIFKIFFENWRKLVIFKKYLKINQYSTI